jgi:hypothetical protein
MKRVMTKGKIPVSLEEQNDVSVTTPELSASRSICGAVYYLTAPWLILFK